MGLFGNQKKGGIAALATVLLLGAIIVEIALVAVLVLRVVTGLSFGTKLSLEALAAAEAGLEDAKLKLSRDKDYVFPASYSLSVGDREATIAACRGWVSMGAACDTVATGKIEITAVGRALAKYHQMRAILDVDPVSGRVLEISRQEIPY